MPPLLLPMPHFLIFRLRHAAAATCHTPLPPLFSFSLTPLRFSMLLPWRRLIAAYYFTPDFTRHADYAVYFRFFV
jgi:hypothetical protein